MTEKRRMPAELLAHFKTKKGEGSEDKETTAEEKKESDKVKRKEALHKARTRLEESSRRKGDDEESETGKKGAKKA